MSNIPPSSAGPPEPLPSRPELPAGVWRPEPPASGGEDGSWERQVPLWSPFAIALAAFALASIAYAVIVGAAGLSAAEAEDAPGPLLGATLVQDLLLIGGAVFVVGLAVKGGATAALGLRRARFWPAVGWAAAVLGTYWLATAIVVGVFGEPPEQEITEEIKSETALIALVGYISITCLMAPLAEELFFRGLLFPVLRSRFGVVWGVLVSGALFSLVHALGSPAEALIVLFVLGAGLCLLYLRTGSLLPCIGLHALNNAISFAVTKEMEWPVAIVTVVGSVVVSVAIGRAFVRPGARPVGLGGTA
jgi:membrane protease YdiL (CAAX protease family)